MSMIDTTETERKIAERLDPAAAGALELSQQAGGLGFSNMAEAMQFAKIMAISGFAVPKHLRGNPGACMAITIQAVEWKLSPFAVANKSYLVNDRLAYESQLIQAVVLQRAPIKGRFHVEFSGEGDKRRCTITATLKDGGEKDYTSPEIGKIPIKNSPLWKNDPDQQLFYYSGRALCRRHFPDVLLGIYTPEELYEAEEPRRGPEHARDVTPKKTLPDELAAGGNGNGDQQSSHDPDTGEIISEEMAERAQAVTKVKNSERAEDAALDDPTGEAAAALDIGTQRLLYDARARASKGIATFTRWENALNQTHADQLAPYLGQLRAEANAADAAKESR